MDKKEVQTKFGACLKKCRTTIGKSQEELAHEAEISTVYLGIIERGERCPTIDILLKLSAALEVSPLQLLVFGEETDNAQAEAVITYALKDLPDKDKMKLALMFEQLVKIYKDD